MELIKSGIGFLAILIGLIRFWTLHGKKDTRDSIWAIIGGLILIGVDIFIW